MKLCLLNISSLAQLARKQRVKEMDFFWIFRESMSRFREEREQILFQYSTPNRSTNIVTQQCKDDEGDTEQTMVD